MSFVCLFVCLFVNVRAISESNTDNNNRSAHYTQACRTATHNVVLVAFGLSQFKSLPGDQPNVFCSDANIASTYFLTCLAEHLAGHVGDVGHAVEHWSRSTGHVGDVGHAVEHWSRTRGTTHCRCFFLKFV